MVHSIVVSYPASRDLSYRHELNVLRGDIKDLCSQGICFNDKCLNKSLSLAFFLFEKSQQQQQPLYKAQLSADIFLN